MKFIIGKKIEMTQIWQGDNLIAVTKVEAGPCQITQVKTALKDGYEAVQICFGSRKLKNINKPQQGHLKKAGAKMDEKNGPRFSREFRFEGIDSSLMAGGVIKTDTFQVGDTIQVTGISKGKGFQGVVRRHGFKGTDEQHGNKDQSRMPGSVGAKGPAHVFKGTRMAGRMGNDRVTVKSLKVIEIDNENNFLYIQGALPGARNSLVMISGEGDLKITEEKEIIEAVKDEKLPETDNSKEKTVEKKEEVAPVLEKTEEKDEAKKVVETKEVQPKAQVETPEQVEKEVVEAKKKVDESQK
jgi:large subunit ribosomal protein L3